MFSFFMKLTHREKILCQPAIYILLSIVFWGLSLYVFIHRSTSWQLTPAESRTYNRECMLLRFYDTHDIWHFLSAFSMFFSFMVCSPENRCCVTKFLNVVGFGAFIHYWFFRFYLLWMMTWSLSPELKSPFSEKPAHWISLTWIYIRLFFFYYTFI